MSYIVRTFSEIKVGDEVCGVGTVEKLVNKSSYVQVKTNNGWWELDGLVRCLPEKE